MLRELDAGDAEAALAAVDEKRLAARDFADDAEVEVGRRVHFGERRGLREGEALRKRHAHALRHRDPLRVAAAAEERAHGVARLEAAAGGRLAHDAGAFEAGPERPVRRRGVDAGALHEIGAVHGRGLDVDHDVEDAMHGGIGDFAPEEGTVFADRDCLHLTRLLSNGIVFATDAPHSTPTVPEMTCQKE